MFCIITSYYWPPYSGGIDLSMGSVSKSKLYAPGARCLDARIFYSRSRNLFGLCGGWLCHDSNRRTHNTHGGNFILIIGETFFNFFSFSIFIVFVSDSILCRLHRLHTKVKINRATMRYACIVVVGALDKGEAHRIHLEENSGEVGRGEGHQGHEPL